MRTHINSNAATLVESSGVSGVFTSGIPVAGGSVGCADIVFHDSPPLTGWASNAAVSFLSFAPCRVTLVTFAQMNVF
ncbi:MAG: hypothetical protein JO097_05500 [Acidobacteriaceae bacterium]|nr:hypothetical protein [Acidobacteriaceae bacterium]MBV9764347.1 hypothetical protein [Acidobacteriaceae bacterium]